MWQSLSKIASLPPETMICSGHEYTASNIRFALSVDAGNPALQERAKRVRSLRDLNEPTVPTPLSEELATNPFLRADDPAIRRHLGMEQASDAEVFATLRALKDRF
jgi:hydroxyacylglutathione hydrolase